MGRKSRSKRTTPARQGASSPAQAVTTRGVPGVFAGWQAGAAAALITFILYLPALGNGFVYWDDPRYVYENTNIRSIDFNFLKWAFTFHAANWHPLTWLSHAIDYAIFGLKPWGHHLTGVALHSLNTFLLFMTASFLIRSTPSLNADGRAPGRRHLIAAGTAALLFGIMPVHVESVAWISERKDVLSTFFFLLSILFYTGYATGGSRRSYLLGLASFALALLSKPMAITLPAVLLLLDIYPFRRLSAKGAFTSNRNVLAEKIPFIALSMVSVPLTVLAQKSAGAVVSLVNYPLQSRIINALGSVGFYIEKTFVPSGLSPFYPFPEHVSFSDPEILIRSAVALIITALCVLAWRKGNRGHLIVWLYFVITLLPVLGIVQVGRQSAANRYDYIPSIGPLLLAGFGIALFYEKAGKRLKTAAAAALLILFGLNGWITASEIGYWKDSEALWTRIISRYPGYIEGYLTRAEVYTLSGRHSEALKDIGAAIGINPMYHGSYYDRGLVYTVINDYPRSIEDFSRAIELNPKADKEYYNRSIVRVMAGDYKNALDDINRFISIMKEKVSPFAYYTRAIIHVKLDEQRKAVEDLTLFLKDPPESSASDTEFSSYLEKAAGLTMFGNTSISPRYMAHLERAAALMKLGEYRNALEDAQRAIDIDPGLAKAFVYRATIHFAKGDHQKAVDDFTSAIELNPRDPEPYGKRGTVLLSAGRKDAAVKDFQEAARRGDRRSQTILSGQGLKW